MEIKNKKQLTYLVKLVKRKLMNLRENIEVCV